MAALEMQLDDFASMVVYYVHAEDRMHVTALINTRQRNDAINLKRFHYNHAAHNANAMHKEALRARMMIKK
jgi:hypothetical protein